MSKIGRYTVVRKTGSHGVAQLYEAFDPVMNRPVTICLAEHPTDPGSRPEAQPVLFDSRQVANLDHPNIVRVLACEADEDRPYFVMERVEGKTLDELLAEGGKLTQDQILQMVKQAALALDHIHSKGLVHNGLTAKKVFLSLEGPLKLDGFEMARPARLFDPAQLTPELVSDPGRLPYVAPELLRGDPMDGRADQFSLAAIGVQACSGQLPFQAGSSIDLLCRVMLEKPEVNLGPDIPASVARVLERALAKAPSDRFSSCGSLAGAFEAALTGKPLPDAAPAPPPRAAMAKATVLAPRAYAEAPPAPSRMWLWVGLFLLASALAVGVAAILARRPAAPVAATPIVAPAVKVQTPVPAQAPAKAKAAPSAKAARKTGASQKQTAAPVSKATTKPEEEEDTPKLQTVKPKVVIQ